MTNGESWDQIKADLKRQADDLIANEFDPLIARNRARVEEAEAAYSVGERGPEWFVPSVSGYVYPVRRRRLARLRRLLRLRP